MLKKFYTIALLLLTLSACNFHLRGPVTLAEPLHKVYLQSQNPYGDLARNIKQYLRMSGVQIVNSPQESTAILNINREETTQDLISINSSQQTRQYTLKLLVAFEVLTPKGNTKLAQQTVLETRPLTLQSNQILAGSNQAVLLYSEMRRAIVYDLMMRLSSQDVSRALTKAKP